MRYKEFSSIEEIQKYYDKKTNTYIFKESSITTVLFEANSKLQTIDKEAFSGSNNLTEGIFLAANSKFWFSAAFKSATIRILPLRFKDFNAEAINLVFGSVIVEKSLTTTICSSLADNADFKANCLAF